MKLWQVVQWNNINEKIDGWDTSILAAIVMSLCAVVAKIAARRAITKV